MKQRFALLLIAALYVAVSLSGITWGLPSRSIDPYLFGDDKPWSGEKIARLAGAAEKSNAQRGADVDIDPLRKVGAEPIPLTDTDEKVAAIYLRYRLFTYQPDEMITMMALSGMKPSQGNFDPRLYQYGGLFIYPVGAIIKACGIAGLIDVRSDLTYYLDNPDEFGKFYVAARAYVAAWGLLGLFIVYAITMRIAGQGRSNAWTGILAALLYAMLPVVVCMSHEAKPHLPGAVLMLSAVLFAMRYHETDRPRDWWLTCVSCGAALGMVLSSLPILALIPLVQIQRYHDKIIPPARCVRTAALGLLAAIGVYAITNPYVPINLLINREVLASNLSNSTAMYEISRLGAGFFNMLLLTSEGATLPILVLGIIGLFVIMRRRTTAVIPLATIAALYFIQCVLGAAAKPFEYGRFGLFTDVTLAILTAAGITLAQRHCRRNSFYVAGAIAVGWAAICGYAYLDGFLSDASPVNSRIQAAQWLQTNDGRHHLTADGTIQPNKMLYAALTAEPAPYCCPPMNFARHSTMLIRDRRQWWHLIADDPHRFVFIAASDFRPNLPKPTLISRIEGKEVSASRHRFPDPCGILGTPISWADKPLLLLDPHVRR